MSNSVHLCRSRVIALTMAFAVCSCGGGGDGASPAAPSPNLAARPVEQSDLGIAQVIFGGGSRTPQGFYADPAPTGLSNVATLHVKNTDIDPAATAPQPQYELCTNDWNQALDWSETTSQNAPQYANLVETNEEPRFFEFGRARASDPQFYVRERVYKCSYLDRSNTNLRSAAGAAGQLNQRPLTADELRRLSEYLWQFTMYNNFGHVVLKSGGAATSTALEHTLHIASLVRGGVSASCDRIDVLAWRHSLNTTTGAVALDVQTLWSFGARESSGVASLCAG